MGKPALGKLFIDQTLKLRILQKPDVLVKKVKIVFNQCQKCGEGHIMPSLIKISSSKALASKAAKSF